MSISQQQPITNLPSSLTPAPVTVVRTTTPANLPPGSMIPPQPYATYQAPSPNIMHQAPVEQQNVPTGLPAQQQQGGLLAQPQGSTVTYAGEQHVALSLTPQQQDLLLMSTPQSTQMASLPGASYTPQQTALSTAYSQPPSSQQILGAPPQPFTAGGGAVSGLPATPPTFSLPSVPPTISLGPAPSLSQSVSAQ